mmetsp:Transcript_23171/g.59367  ORF Transcript_23171/g.59367 Transcript_23171/m.59367 type:complete len:207 (+) Transcript_23171:178-798(+)
MNSAHIFLIWRKHVHQQRMLAWADELTAAATVLENGQSVGCISPNPKATIVRIVRPFGKRPSRLDLAARRTETGGYRGPPAEVRACNSVCNRIRVTASISPTMLFPFKAFRNARYESNAVSDCMLLRLATTLSISLFAPPPAPRPGQIGKLCSVIICSDICGDRGLRVSKPGTPGRGEGRKRGRPGRSDVGDGNVDIDSNITSRLE